MLCFITTDCAVSSEMIRKALLFNVKRTFNRVTVDGDTHQRYVYRSGKMVWLAMRRLLQKVRHTRHSCEALQAVMQDLAS